MATDRVTNCLLVIDGLRRVYDSSETLTVTQHEGMIYFSLFSPNDKNALPLHPGGHAVRTKPHALPDDGIGRLCRVYRLSRTLLQMHLVQSFMFSNFLLFAHARFQTGWEGASAAHTSLALGTPVFITVAPSQYCRLGVRSLFHAMLNRASRPLRHCISRMQIRAHFR